MPTKARFSDKKNLKLSTVYMMRKYLRMPFTEYPQYEAGLIDSSGDPVKKRLELSASERKLLSVFDICILNVKQLMHNTNTERYINDYAKILIELQDELYESEEDLAMINRIIQRSKLIAEQDIEEDVAAVSISGGAVDNTVTPVKPKDQPKFKVKKRKKMTLPR